MYGKVFHLGLHLADTTPGHLTSEVTVVEDQAWKWVKSPLFTSHWPELMHSFTHASFQGAWETVPLWYLERGSISKCRAKSLQNLLSVESS